MISYREGIADLEVEISDLRFSSATYYLCNLVPLLHLVSKPVSLSIKRILIMPAFTSFIWLQWGKKRMWKYFIKYKYFMNVLSSNAMWFMPNHHFIPLFWLMALQFAPLLSLGVEAPRPTMSQWETSVPMALGLVGDGLRTPTKLMSFPSDIFPKVMERHILLLLGLLHKRRMKLQVLGALEATTQEQPA